MSKLDPVDSSRPGGTTTVAGTAAPETPIFGSQPEERGGLPMAAWGIAATIVLLAVGLLVVANHKKPVAAPNVLLPADAYAASLPLSQFAMSESASLSGGKLTYLDGHVANTGGRTVAGITVQVVFQNDVQLPPAIETIPLTLIRMREPYIDTEPVGTEPIRPGEDREFRLIFESVPDNWNTQMPEVRIVHTELK